MSESSEKVSPSLAAGWLAHVGERRTPITHKCDRHERVATLPWKCELQHERGGRLTVGLAHTASRAVVAAVLLVHRLCDAYVIPEGEE